MKKIIFCNFFKKKLKKQNFQIYPGKLGKRIYEEISEKAWKVWIKKQTILINEQKLNMFNVEDRKKLENYMKKFFFE